MFKLNPNGTLANKVGTGEWHGVETSSEYIAWIAAGNTPEPANPPPPLVYICDPWQIRKALTQLGLRDAVERAVAASTDQALKDGWAHAPRFVSDDPFVIAMGAALGKTPEETAAVIQLGSTL